ncbi:MAG: hypothetical protein ASARMPREDX12_009593 [Alectoria sarmentosa]|nr:MAG: hypothetical protein ASARMPREDX12_009593 [Alectoria sarmentosa]
MVQNKGLIFKSVPTDWPVEGKDLTIEDREFDLDAEPPKGGLTIKTYYVSFDPYQRGCMRPPEVASYSGAYPLGKPITNSAVSKVLRSNNPIFKEGDIVTGTLPTEEYSRIPGDAATYMFATHKVTKLDNPYNLDPKLFVGALGMPGLTAYASFYEIGQPKKGETIFISAASGAVGQIVGQLAKHEGLKVIGSVGSDEKLDFIRKELDFDDGFNYKKEKPSDALERLAPNGVDIYFENVGGEQLDSAIAAMNNFGRIIACGMISQYNISDSDKKYGVKNIAAVVGKRLKMQGFIVGDANMGPKYAADHQKNVAKWISEGTFKAQQSVTVGIDNAIKGLLGMFKGENFGKAVLTIEDMK